MSETPLELEPVVEPGQDFTELVTVGEIGIVARQLGADPIGAIEQGTGQRWEAMARLGWVLERRRNQTATVDRWLGLTLSQLLDTLRVDEQADEDDDDPTEPAPGQ